MPNHKTVSFINNEQFDIYLTNKVFGIKNHFGHSKAKASTSRLRLRVFAKSTVKNNIRTFDKYNGDKKF